MEVADNAQWSKSAQLISIIAQSLLTIITNMDLKSPSPLKKWLETILNATHADPILTVSPSSHPFQARIALTISDAALRHNARRHVARVRFSMALPPHPRTTKDALDESEKHLSEM